MKEEPAIVNTHRDNYYRDLAADFSRPRRLPPEVGDRLIAEAERHAALLVPGTLPGSHPEDAVRIEAENRAWWPTHCEALRRGRADLLAAEYRDDLVYLCQDGPFHGKGSGTSVEASWWKLLSQPGVTMSWPIVMFSGDVVYFEWRCEDDATGETTAKGNVTFLRRGHAGGVYLKTEQLTFYRDVNAAFFSR
jgi:hypothetical protein